MKRYKLIACKALFREISLIAADTRAVLDVTFMRRGLHDTPNLLREALQKEIDAVDSGGDMHSNDMLWSDDFDAILLGYGLCSNGVAGLTSKKHPLVVPRCDDCIALYIGSYKQYRDFHAQHPGTYWYNASWIENGYTPSESMHHRMLAEYTAQYGAENAAYIMDTESAVKNYNTAAYVAWKELDFPEYEQYTQEAAEYFDWQYKRVQGDSGWLRDFLSGNHDKRFAVAQPGETLAQDLGGSVIKSCSACRV